MATKPITELDFDQIKESLIDYIKSDTTFTDYNFEGSALNSIMDILAYNTHTNAYYANMLHSESFLDTAQKRSSVVSRAKELGYTPKSVTCSTAYVNAYTSGISNLSTQFYIPRGTAFTSSNESGTFTFLTQSDVFSVLEGSVHKFSNIKLLSGLYVKNSFTVDTLTNVRSLFTIPNENIDTSTLRVFVKSSNVALDKTEYKLSSSVFDAARDSEIYYIQESYSGKFEIYFGDNIIGKQPANGNVIEIDYFVSDSPTKANGCRFFSTSISFDSGVTIDNIETTQVSFGGSLKDSLQTIKFNAINTNVSKGRAVTASDYSTLLISQFPFIKSVNSWGGEDNFPPVFGKIFLSMQPVAGYTISDSVKTTQILPVIKKNSLVTITPEFVDPTYTFLEFSTKAKFYKNKTVLTAAEIEASIRYQIETYVSSISSFNSEYIHSQLMRNCLNIDPSIVSVDIATQISYNIVPYVGVSTNCNFSFNNAIVDGSISSSIFYMLSNGVSEIVSIKQIPNSYVDIVLGIVNVGAYNISGQLIRNIGTANLKTGHFSLVVNVSGYINPIIKYIKLKVTPVEMNISTKNNQILALDVNIKDGISGIIDNDYILVEEYIK